MVVKIKKKKKEKGGGMSWFPIKEKSLRYFIHLKANGVWDQYQFD